MKKKHLLICSALALLCACSSEQKETLPPSNVTFTGTIIPTTRATDTSFENGDGISVYAIKQGALYADNAKYVYQLSTNQFTASTGAIVVPDVATQYYAIYPYKAYSRVDNQTLKFQFSVNADQSSSANYTLSDLCTATSSPTTSENVNLTFSHRLSKVVVNLVGQSIPSDISIQLKGVMTNLTMDVEANTFTANGSTSNVTMGSNGNNSFRAIVPTQFISSIIIKQGNSTKEVIVSKTLSAGVQSELTVEVRGDTYVVINGDINDWGDEPDPDPVQLLFEEPCVNWGGSVNAVKQFMNTNGYTLASDIQANDENTSYYMMYEGKHKEFLVEYDFTTQTGNLTDAYLLFDAESVAFDDLVSVFEKDESFKYVSYNEDYKYHRFYREEANTITIVDVRVLTEDLYYVNYWDYSAYNSQVKAHLPKNNHITLKR